MYSLSASLSILISCFFKRFSLKAVVLSCLPLLLVAALRQFVGTDYASYYYNKIPIILESPIQLEFGFSLLAFFSVAVLGSYQWLIAGMACVTCFCYWIFIYRYSRNVPFSILIFVALGCYYFSLNAMRQSVAMAIFFFSIQFIEKKNLKKFLLCIFFAFSFHSSALLYIPFYWLSRVHIKNRLLISVSLFLYVIYPFFSMVVYPLILGKYASYFEWGVKSGFNWRFLLPLLGLIVLDSRMKMQKKVLEVPNNDKLNLLRNLAIFSFWACNLSPTLTGASAARVIYFFLPATVVYFSYVINVEKYFRFIMYMLFVAIFFWTTNEGAGGILPYHSIFSDYKVSYRTYIYDLHHSENASFKKNN